MARMHIVGDAPSNVDSSSFPATSWTRVGRAQQTASEEAFEAISELCEAYWYPLYANLRGSGSSPEDAADLTQGFLTLLVEQRLLKHVSPEKGKLRTYLLNAVQKFRAQDFPGTAGTEAGWGCCSRVDR